MYLFIFYIHFNPTSLQSFARGWGKVIPPLKNQGGRVTYPLFYTILEDLEQSMDLSEIVRQTSIYYRIWDSWTLLFV